MRSSHSSLKPDEPVELTDREAVRAIVEMSDEIRYRLVDVRAFVDEIEDLARALGK